MEPFSWLCFDEFLNLETFTNQINLFSELISCGMFACAVGKHTQTPHCWCEGEKPPFALYGHRYDGRETGAKKTYNVRASKEVLFEPTLKYDKL